MVNIKKKVLLTWLTIITIALTIYLTNMMINVYKPKKQMQIKHLEFATKSLTSTGADLLQYEKIVLDPNTHRIMRMTTNNRANQSLYYSVWYEVIDVNCKDDVIITKSLDSGASTTGTLATSQMGEVVLDLYNQGDNPVAINIGIIYSKNDDHELSQNRFLVANS